jgi:hypothetical protein
MDNSPTQAWCGDFELLTFSLWFDGVWATERASPGGQISAEIMLSAQQIDLLDL